MSKEEIAISVKSVSKSFKLPHEKHGSIKNALINTAKGKLTTYEKQEVLKDISFDIKEGEFFGIVGRNGSGKSTLLKLLAGVYSPDKGHIHINGKLTPFIELGVGFSPELTGQENVYLNGALLGFSRKEMDEMYDEIVAFAELEKFMYQKLKNYSSGMQVRLAFSIAIRAKGDILLFDEVLAVGDAAFQKKCYEAFVEMKKQGRTIVFVTHDMTAVERFCDRVMVVSEGKTSGILSPSEAGSIYDELNAQTTEATSTKKVKRWGTGDVKLRKIDFYSNGKALNNNSAKTGEELEIRIELSGSKEEIVVGLSFEDAFGVNVSGPNSKGVVVHSKAVVSYRVPKLSLLPGDYKVTVAIFDKEVVKEYDHHEKAFDLRVTSSQRDLHGKVHLFGHWGNIK